MYEIEIKAWIYEPEKIEKKLEEIGAKKIDEFSLKDVYYRHPCYDFKERDEELRLRYKKGKIYVTFKGKADEKREKRLEIEFEVPKEFEALLECLGFEPCIEKVKHVKRFEYGRYTLELVKVEHLGFFIEIEKMCEEKEGSEDLYELLGRLGIPRERIERRYYTEMLEELGYGRV